MGKNTILKLIKIFTIISAGITIISGVGPFAIGYLLAFMMGKQASSIGIIGGADGPTAIFLSTTSSRPSVPAIFGALTVMGLLLQMIIRRNRHR